MALSKGTEIEETDVVAQYAQKYASFMTSTPGLEKKYQKLDTSGIKAFV